MPSLITDHRKIQPDTLQSMPLTLTSVSNLRPCRIFQFVVVNPTAAPVNIQARDGATVQAIPNAPVPAQSMFVFNFPKGYRMVNDFRLQAASSGLLYSLEGWYED